MKVYSYHCILKTLAVCYVIATHGVGAQLTPFNASAPIRICSLIKGPWLVPLVPDKVFNWPTVGPNASVVTDNDFYK